MFTKDKNGLYFNGEFVTNEYSTALKKMYELDELPSGFCIIEDFDAPFQGYSVIDKKGVQHIFDLDAQSFYNNFSDSLD